MFVHPNTFTHLFAPSLSQKIIFSFKNTLSKDHQYFSLQPSLRTQRRNLSEKETCQKLLIHQRRSIIKNGSCSSKKKYIKKYFSRLILVKKEKKKKKKTNKKEKKMNIIEESSEDLDCL